MSVSILGVRVDNVTMEEAVSRVGEMVAAGGSHYVVTPNAEFVVAAQTDSEFRGILNRADLAIPDGVGILAAAKYLTSDFSAKPWFFRLVLYFIYGLQIGWAVLFDRKFLDVVSSRVSGSDLVPRLVQNASRKGWSVFLLGAERGVAERVSQLLTNCYPSLRVLGALSGNPKLRFDKEVRGAVKDISRGEHIDLLFVAYGHKKQEKWIADHMGKIKVPWMIGVGAAFDFHAGTVKRAPLLFRKAGLEWLYRVCFEPRMIKRNIFSFMVILFAIKERFAGRHRILNIPKS